MIRDRRLENHLRSRGVAHEDAQISNARLVSFVLESPKRRSRTSIKTTDRTCEIKRSIGRIGNVKSNLKQRDRFPSTYLRSIASSLGI